MKFNLILLVTITLLSSTVNPKPLTNSVCQMKLLQNDYDQWHDVVEGMVFGMFDAPTFNISNCWTCDNLGKSVAAMQMITVSLNNDRLQWITDGYLKSLAFFDKI